VLGRHDGIVHFTVGQRRGIGLGGGDPLYVLRLDAAANRVTVGPRARLAAPRARLREVNWLIAPPAAPLAVRGPRAFDPARGGGGGDGLARRRRDRLRRAGERGRARPGLRALRRQPGLGRRLDRAAVRLARRRGAR
jgi:hypothetical protein